VTVEIRAETASGIAQVLVDPARPSGRLLLLDGVANGYVDFRDPEYLGIDYLHRLAAALDVLVPRGEPIDVLHLGGGAFALPRRIAATRPAARQEVVELDPAIVALARTHLRLRPGPALRVIVQDARVAVERRPGASADVVVCDAFAGTEVPAGLLTPQFARAVRRVLRPDGVYLLNVIDVAPPAIAPRAVASVLTAFPDAVVFGAEGVVRAAAGGNVLLAAGAHVSEPTLRRLDRLPHPSLVRDAAAYAGDAEPLAG
jgi:spermidine synthase